MNILGFKPSTVDGEGIRYAIFVAGCSHHCKGCQNQYSWNPDAGRKLTAAMWKDILAKIISRERMIDGITLSGGDPLYIDNRDAVYQIVKDLKRAMPNKTIWLYTGYLWDEIKTDESMLKIARIVDIIVDGEYRQDLEPAKYRGSKNQKIIRTRLELEALDYEEI